jgi:geranylgeranyl diphosphate synthase type I
MNWEKAFINYGVLVEERLRKLFDEILGDARDYHPFIEKVYSSLQEFVFRKGKRLAFCSTLLTYKGYINRIDDEILKVAVGIELYRHCILVHDDLVDRDEYRRGEKTIHKVFHDRIDERFGGGVAVFTGNMAYTLAATAILNSGFEEERLAKVLHILQEGYREVNESQILDLFFESEEVDVNEWYVMASKRAASLFKITMLAAAYWVVLRIGI